MQMALATVLSTFHVAKYDTGGRGNLIRDHGPTTIVLMTCRLHSSDAGGNGELKWINYRGEATAAGAEGISGRLGRRNLHRQNDCCTETQWRSAFNFKDGRLSLQPCRCWTVVLPKGENHSVL